MSNDKIMKSEKARLSTRDLIQWQADPEILVIKDAESYLRIIGQLYGRSAKMALFEFVDHLQQSGIALDRTDMEVDGQW